MFLRTTGILMSADRNQRNTCRALPSSRNFVKTIRTALHVFVGIDLDLACFTPAEARRKHEPELAAPRLGITGSDAALPHQAEFVFRHRPLQPEQQAVVDDSRIVGAIRIDDEGASERAQIDQMMPVPPVARQARRLDAVDSADIARAHHRDKPLEAGTLHSA